MPSVSRCRAVASVVTIVVSVALAGTARVWSAPQLPRITAGKKAANPVDTSGPADGSSEGSAEEPTGVPRAETVYAVRKGVATDSLNLRSGPATSFARIVLLRKGADLRVQREQGDWLYVNAEDDNGWVHRDFVELDPRSVPEPELLSELERLRARESAWQTERRSLEQRVVKLERDREDLQIALRSLRGEVSFALASEKPVPENSVPEDTVPEDPVPEKSTPEPLVSPEVPQEQIDAERKQMSDELVASEQARESLWANLATLRAENASLREELARRPAAGAVSEIADGSRVETVLPERVVGWAEAWSAQSFDDYIVYYAREFDPADDLSLEAWRAIRASRLTRPEFIRVAIGSISVDQTGPARATTTFEQSYESNRYSDKVRKRLDWVEEEGTWRIARESSEPIR